VFLFVQAAQVMSAVVVVHGCVIPCPFEAHAALQGVHADSPLVAVKSTPSVQLRHSDSEVAPGSARYFPAEHATQLPDSMYCPAGQPARHVVIPPLARRSEGQAWQAVCVPSIK